MSSTKECFQVVVVSDRVYEGAVPDTSGEIAIGILREKGYCVEPKMVVRNTYRDILRALRSTNSRIVVMLGGTGPSPRDITVDVVEDVSWRCLPGFGEAFRQVSYSRIGPQALLSRAALCILYDGRVVTVLPGSPDATSVGLELLLQLVDHLIEEVDRFETPHRSAQRVVE